MAPVESRFGSPDQVQGRAWMVTTLTAKEARMNDNAGVRSDDPPLSPVPLTRRQSLDARQYDSFVVRVWRHPGDDRLVRADVRHVQSGASQSAIDCDAGWIGKAVGQQLREHGSRPQR